MRIGEEAARTTSERCDGLDWVQVVCGSAQPWGAVCAQAGVIWTQGRRRRRGGTIPEERSLFRLG